MHLDLDLPLDLHLDLDIHLHLHIDIDFGVSSGVDECLSIQVAMEIAGEGGVTALSVACVRAFVQLRTYSTVVGEILDFCGGERTCQFQRVWSSHRLTRRYANETLNQ